MSNRLIQEQSPYLLQHAHNPVDWYPWGDEPFERAKKENKPVLVSIGYAACHWCHVMERESFESAEVAAYMNEHFINIKVDREEHPDVDHLYMDAVQAISGSGGWPLNVFVTPERLPFYGGTYFPPRPAFNRPSWIQLLERINEIWHNQIDEVRAQSEQMLQHLKQASLVGFSDNNMKVAMDDCRVMSQNLLKMGDKQHGGFGRAPKFPGTMAISFLLEHHHYTGNKDALDLALLSLDKMIEGGIYDQIGGGFARYSTDEKWLAPHFEKMLYDNALLILALCDADQITSKLRYKEVIEETIAFVERELKDESGVYYCALDADSDGEEGKFYTWNWEDWKAVVDDEVVEQYFGVVKEGNWEHTNILHVSQSIEELSEKMRVSITEVQEKIDRAKSKLFKERSRRVRPQTDDKSLLSWNALMNLALSRSGVVLQRDEILLQAEEHMQLLLDKFQLEGKLKHVWKKGVARIDANLDDYAYLIKALLQLASAVGNDEWIVTAAELCTAVIKEFQHESGNFFYYTSIHQKDIPVRKVDLYDGATPSANAVMAHNLLLLGMSMERSDWVEQASFMLHKMVITALRYTYSFGYWAILLERSIREIKTIVVAESKPGTNYRQIQQKFLPHCYLLASKKEISEVPVLKEKEFSGESLIFVCTGQACLPPVKRIEEILQLI